MQISKKTWRKLKCFILWDISNYIVTALDIAIFKRQLHYAIFIPHYCTNHEVEQVNLFYCDNNVRCQRRLSASFSMNGGIYVRALYAQYSHHMGAINHIDDFFRESVSFTGEMTDSSTDLTNESNADSLDDPNS